MPRIPYLDTRRADGYALDLLEDLKERLGHVPNLHRAIAQSPAALGGLLDLERKLRVSSLPGRLRSLATLVVARARGNDDARARRRTEARLTGWSEEELAAVESGATEGLAPAERAVLRFTEGWLAGEDPEAGAVAEIVIHLKPAQIVDLTLALALTDWTTRFARVFDIDPDPEPAT